MWNRLNVRLMASTSTLSLLVMVLEAGRKWY